MSKTPNFDAKVKEILDAIKPGERVCTLTGERWMMDEEEISWYKKFHLPPATVAPTYRMVVLASFGNSYQWWYQKHPETGKQILTYVHPASGIKVLPDVEWFDKDFSGITAEDDPSRPFFDVMYELERKIPFRASRNMREPINSLCMVSLGDENDFLTMGCKAKNCLMSIVAEDSESSAQLFFSYHVNDSFQISQSDRIYNCRYLNVSYDCVNSSFLFDCRNCEDCFGASNKRNAKYVFWNEQLTEEEYKKRMQEVDLSCRSKLEEYKAKYHQMMQEAVWPENFNVKADDCIGEYLNNCLNCRFSYCCSHGPKNSYWLNFSIEQSENNAFCDGAVSSSECYNDIAVSESNRCFYCFGMTKCRACEYSMICFNCEDCFGCVGLNRKRFCIFNKQYSEEEYWKKLDEIKCRMMDRGEYGDFFPLNHSSAQQTESTAMIMGFGTDEIAKMLHANQFDITAEGAVGNADAANTAQLSEIPDCIDAINDDWIGRPIYDPEIGRRFMFFPQEIAFYKKFRLAPPAKHFITRMKEMINERNIADYEEATCAKCQTKITVAKNLTFPMRNIFCSSCYNQFLEKNS